METYNLKECIAPEGRERDRCRAREKFIFLLYRFFDGITGSSTGKQLEEDIGFQILQIHGYISRAALEFPSTMDD